MTTSVRYRDLRRALRRLRLGLLPTKFSATGAYRNARSVHVRSVSFRMLAHAEIESFLEDRASQLASVAMEAWKLRRVTCDVTAGLLAFAGFETQRPPMKLGGDPSNQKAYDDVDVVLQRANAAWRHGLKNNHGIKEANVLSLFLPLGIKSAALGSTLLADLSSYGALRGEVAHSSSLSVTVLADPKTELDKAQQLVEDLRALDEAVSTAINRVRRVDKALLRF